MAQKEIDSRYLQARNIALEANAIKGASSCIGDSACCTSIVAISNNDMLVITSDIESGKISRGTVENAIERSKMPENGRCPFLTDTNLCSIYESRPYQCITWGIGGKPLPKKTYATLVDDWKRITESGGQIRADYEQAAKEWRDEGKPSTVPNLAVEQATCLECRFNTAWNGTPIEANERIREADRIMETANDRLRKSTTRFAREDLPKLIGEEPQSISDTIPMSRQLRRQLVREQLKIQERKRKH